MTFEIYKDGALANRIVARESFCEFFCKKQGFTYLPTPGTEPNAPESPAPTLAERVMALEEENAALAAAVERGLSL